METILTTEQMREADRLTIDGLLNGNGTLLMEHAASACVRVLSDMYGPAMQDMMVGVAAGCGNNGGDGMAMARMLVSSGVDVSLFLVGERNRLSPDAAMQLNMLANYPVPVIPVTEESLDQAVTDLSACHILVDALLGTGLRDEPRGLVARFIDGLNGRETGLIMAVDIPSGLASDSSRVPVCSMRADCTVTFGRKKPAHILPPASDRCGYVVVDDITIPGWIVEQVGPELFVPETSDALTWLPPLQPDGHKGTAGHVGVIAGRRGRLGAGILAGKAALHTGAGLVTVYVSEDDYPVVAGMVPELMFACEPLSADREFLDSFVRDKRVLAVGPGFGTEGPDRERLLDILSRVGQPVILDADGFRLLKPRDIVDLELKNAVLTPHPGELAAFMDTDVATIQADRLGTARRAAAAVGNVVVLKGRATVVAAPDGRAWINPTGNAGMGTAGSGDVLTGMIASLVGQGRPLLDSAIGGVFLHGFAGDLARDRESARAVTATAMIDRIGPAIRKLTGDN